MMRSFIISYFHNNNNTFSNINNNIIIILTCIFLIAVIITSTIIISDHVSYIKTTTTTWMLNDNNNHNIETQFLQRNNKNEPLNNDNNVNDEIRNLQFLLTPTSAPTNLDSIRLDDNNIQTTLLPTISPIIDDNTNIFDTIETTQQTLSPTLVDNNIIRSVNMNYTNITLTIPGIGKLNTNETIDFEIVTKKWFNNYYNDRPVLGILDMDTNIKIVDQNVQQRQRQQSSNSKQEEDSSFINILTLDQYIDYNVLIDKNVFEPEQYITAPFADQIANRNYRNLLSNENNVFITIYIDQTDLLIPKLSDSDDITTTVKAVGDENNDAGICFSIGAIIGTAIGTAVFTALIMELIFLKYRQRSTIRGTRAEQKSSLSRHSENNNSSTRQSYQISSTDTTRQQSSMDHHDHHHTDRTIDDDNYDNSHDDINDVNIFGGVVGLLAGSTTPSRATEPEGDLITPDYKDQVRDSGRTLLPNAAIVEASPL